MDNLKQTVLSSTPLKLLVVMGSGFFFFSLIFLLPGEAHDLKSFKYEKEQLDKQTQELQAKYSKLDEKLALFSQLQTDVKAQKDMIQVKTPDEVKK